MTDHQLVGHDDWITARGRFLAREKEFTRLREELSREWRELPWECVKKEYLFEGENGGETLAHLFGGRSQLIVYHFMYEPDWDIGCKNRSLWADGRHLTGTTGEIAGSGKALRLDVQVGLLRWQRFQP